MSHRWVVGLFVGLFMVGVSLAPAEAGVVNGGFETGDFTGWTLSHPTLGSVVTSHDGDYVTYAPVEGSYFAVLWAGAGTGVYTTLSQQILLNAGDTLAGMAAFDYRDYDPFDDEAYVRVYDEWNNLVATPWYEHGLAHPDYWDGPWTPWSWTAPSSGIYLLEFGIANQGDNLLPSAALFDIPEASTFGLLGLGIVGFLVWGRRRTTA